MTTPAWPVSVPSCPIGGSYSEKPASSVVRNATEVGPGKQRRRSTAINVATSLTIKMTTTEKDAFDDFYADDLSNGSLRFTMPYAVGGATKTFKFVDDPQFDRRGPLWFVALSLARLD